MSPFKLYIIALVIALVAVVLGGGLPAFLLILVALGFFSAGLERQFDPAYHARQRAARRRGFLL